MSTGSAPHGTHSEGPREGALGASGFGSDPLGGVLALALGGPAPEPRAQVEQQPEPQRDADDRASITLNCEIYNYRELKPRFTAAGFPFRTQSDTEAILAAWLFDGPDGLDALEGMFAFALWDKATRTLFAARDRFGKKPFYYTVQNGVFAFASELTALATLPFVAKSVRVETLARFLAYEYTPTPETIYAHVSKLEPVVAKPHLPDNKALARACRDVKVTLVYIGSCTGGKLDDFVMAAKIMKGRKVAVRTLIVPATRTVEQGLVDTKIDGQSLRQIFESAGVEPIAPPSCAACRW